MTGYGAEHEDGGRWGYLGDGWDAGGRDKYPVSSLEVSQALTGVGPLGGLLVRVLVVVVEFEPWERGWVGLGGED